MNQRVLRAVQQVLVAALSVVLVAVIFMAFLRIVRPREPGPVSFGTTTTIPTTGETSTTTTLDGVAVTSTTSTTTTTVLPASVTCTAPRPEAGEGVTLLRVYFSCGDPNGPPAPGTYVVRAVPETQQVLTATLTEMLEGPSADEQSVGFQSYMSETTDGLLRGVNIAEGTAVVDLAQGFFAGFDPAVSSVDHLLSDLSANVFQFETIAAVEYRLGGSCAAFWQTLGNDGCTVLTRADWVRLQAGW